METILIGQDQERHFDNLRGRCVAKLPPLIYAPPSEGYVRDTSTEPLISETDKARVYLLGHFNQHQDSTSHLHETCGGNVTSNTSNIERNVDEQWQHQSVAGGIPESMHLKFVRLQRRNTTARFGCSMCEKRFFYKCHLRIHEKIHSGVKPYSCKHCSRRFRQSGSLTVHMRRHTGEQPYECRICKRKFRHCNSLKRHQAKVHTLAEQEDASSDVARKKKKSTKTLLKMEDSFADNYHYKMDSPGTLKSILELGKESVNVGNFNPLTPVTGDREGLVDMGSRDINFRNPNHIAAPVTIWRPFLVDSSAG